MAMAMRPSSVVGVKSVTVVGLLPKATMLRSWLSAWVSKSPLKSSALPWIVLVAGLSGAVGAMGLQWWVHAVRYPLVFAAKPFFSWQAFIPVTFEVMVLFSALGAVFGMFHMNRLPRLHHPLFSSTRFERFSDDRFFISIQADDPKFDLEQTQSLLRECGALGVEVVEDVP